MTLRRREFITLLGGAAVGWPAAARAQQTLPVIGYLGSGSPDATAIRVAAFRKGLHEAGYIEGSNVAIEFRWANNQFDRLPELAADLIRRNVAVIVVPFSAQGTLAAKKLTATVPIVFGTTNDPVQIGLVASLNRPGGNVTGVASLGIEIGSKQFGLLHELVPSAQRFALLVNPNSQILVNTVIQEAQSAAAAVGKLLEVVPVGSNSEINSAFAYLVERRTEGLLVGPSVLFTERRVQIVTLAAHYRIPTMYFSREFTEVGGLMSYESSYAENCRRVGIYAGRILRGEKPSDLPVFQAIKFDFTLNLQTAKILGFDVPPMLLARADEVIE